MQHPHVGLPFYEGPFGAFFLFFSFTLEPYDFDARFDMVLTAFYAFRKKEGPATPLFLEVRKT